MSKGYLRRYTNLPALIYFLAQKKLTLLDPRSWSDTNDSYYLQVYRDKKRLKSVLALCFTEESETYHHWGVFAPGAAGACITFKRAEFIEAVQKIPGVRCGSVTYLKLTDLRARQLATAELPFRKRYAFQHEREFRVIYESAREHKESLDVSIPFENVVQITLSPWLPKSLSVPLKQLLHSIDGCGHLRIDRSSLIGNQEWKNAADKAK